ncbi:hypothetical protein BCON_0107g00200 [Botryotinia convoluta]|uniref:Phospholipase/carboxylesterase/thioesterase domain-containing protein n=1 Tax=Botryotinia convoluta TaxID=54673 RepID=A0A4Z1I4N5_9HELO|nr:hypothetical protein BCON_0107g00200 [Botryotinia convoluta]
MNDFHISDLHSITSVSSDDNDPLTSLETTIIALPSSRHIHTFISLHGRGDFGEYSTEDSLKVQSSANRNLAHVFPTARSRSSAAAEAEFGDPTMSEMVKESQSIIDIIEEEAKLVSMDRIILGGISQGCATSISIL